VKGPGGAPPGPAFTEERPIGEEEWSSIAAQIARLSVPAKVELAGKGNREVRRILSRDGSSIVARAVIASPKLTEDDIVSYAASSLTHGDVLRLIADSKQWTANRQVVTALVLNPRTPPQATIRFMKTYQTSELRVLTQNRSLSAAVRQEARRLVAQRH
jgi:fructose-1,6-bisphosphatase/sedoheptulose 1,7-bisphosphatase-like protein